MAGLVVSVAVIVQVPELPKYVFPRIVTVPFARVALAFNQTVVSLLVSATTSLDETMCQVGSQILIVRSKAFPTVCGFGVPILPVVVFGALVSPGSRTCSWD